MGIWCGSDGRAERRWSLPWWNQPGDSSVASLPLNDVQEGGAQQGACVTVDAGTQSFRHSEAAGRGIPHGGAHAQQWTREGRLLYRHPREAGIPLSGAGRYAVATMAEPSGGLRRRKVRGTPLPPCGESSLTLRLLLSPTKPSALPGAPLDSLPTSCRVRGHRGVPNRADFATTRWAGWV